MGPPEEIQTPKLKIHNSDLNELAETGIFDQSGIGTRSRRTTVIHHTQGLDSNFSPSSSELYIELHINLGNYIDQINYAPRYSLLTTNIDKILSAFPFSFTSNFLEHLPHKDYFLFVDLFLVNLYFSGGKLILITFQISIAIIIEMNEGGPGSRSDRFGLCGPCPRSFGYTYLISYHHKLLYRTHIKQQLFT